VEGSQKYFWYIKDCFHGSDVSSRGLLNCDAHATSSFRDLWNDGNLLQHYTASQPRGPRLETSPPWRPQISHPLCSSLIV